MPHLSDQFVSICNHVEVFEHNYAAFLIGLDTHFATSTASECSDSACGLPHA